MAPYKDLHYHFSLTGYQEVSTGKRGILITVKTKKPEREGITQ